MREDNNNDFYEDDEIDLVELISALLRRWKLIFLCTFICLGVGYFYANTRPSIYKAEILLKISSEREIETISNGVKVKTKVDDSCEKQKFYLKLLKADGIAYGYLNASNIDMSVSKFLEKIETENIDGKYFKIKYKSTGKEKVINELKGLVEYSIKEIDSIEKIGKIETISEAKVLRKPEEKNKLMILAVSIILGGMIGCGLALVLEFVNKKLRREEEIENLLNAKLIGRINKNDQKELLFLGKKDDLELKEGIRTLRTNIDFLNTKESNKKIIFTGAKKNENQLNIVLNYAMSIAITNKKVLVIDCDIREPKLAAYFDKKIESGFESVILEDKKIEDVIIKNVEENLDILPIKNIENIETEIFMKENIKNIFKDVENYNVIILNAPDLETANDATILSKYTDGVVVVVEYGKETAKQLEYLAQMLKNANANVYGFVLDGYKQIRI